MKKHLTIHLFLFCLLFLGISSLSAKVIYVNAGAGAGDGDGNSWATAFKTINLALDFAESEDEIWVASASYIGRYAMKAGVNVYGGFTGIESTREERDFVKNRTKLTNTTPGRLFQYTKDGLSEHASFDGFDIINNVENNNGAAGYLTRKMHLRNSRILNNVSLSGSGGGLVIEAGASVEDCIFAGNSSQQSGGALSMAKGGMAKNCIFINNFSRGSSGGAIGATASADGAVYPIIENCLFAHNEANKNGGAIWTMGGYINNCTIVRNKTNDAASNGGGVLLDALITADKTAVIRASEIYNSILWGNDGNNLSSKQIYIARIGADVYKGGGAYCAIEGLNDITLYPPTILEKSSSVSLEDNNSEIKFKNPNEITGVLVAFNENSFETSFDYSTYDSDWNIEMGSIVVNKGDNSKVLSALDLSGAKRIQEGVVDIGAYEGQEGNPASVVTNVSGCSLFEPYLASDKKTLVFSMEDESLVRIYSLTGFIVKSLFCNKGSADIGDLPSGCYILKAGSKTTKFIK